MGAPGQRAWALCVLVAATASACTPTPPAPVSRVPPPPADAAFETGRASWYGEPHHGRRTASGETFDMHALTAAHRTLPLGTRLRVINLTNDRAVEVRVNDRGPFRAGRVLDLSYAAAGALHAVQAGVVPVRIYVLPDR